MQVRYEKDNKERIPFEHYLEEFAAIDPKEAAARVGVPWHEETQEFEVRMMQKAFLVKWPECTIRKANPFDEGYGAMENGVPAKDHGNPIFNKGCVLRRHRKVSDLSGSAAWRSLLPSV